MIRQGLTTSLAAALGVACALLLASCGGSNAKLLPGTTAEEINSNLSSVRELAAEGECVGAEDAALEISGQVSDLREVDPKLKLALEEGAERLNEVVATCDEEARTEETEEEPTTTEAEPSKEQLKEEEKAQKEEEKAQQEAEKEEEKAQQEAEKEAEKEQKEVEKEESEAEAPPKGKAKGHDEAPPAAPPSGGVGPSGEAGD